MEYPQVDGGVKSKSVWSGALSFAVCMLFAVALGEDVPKGCECEVRTDHADLLYGVGETATFSVTVKKSGALVTNGVVHAKLDNFGSKSLMDVEFDLSKGNPFVVRGALDEPGFLRLTVQEQDANSFVWSVAYEPTAIKKGSPSPSDFEDFWHEAKARLAREVPLDAQMQRIAERSTAEFDFYQISFATFGRRVYGYLSVPTDEGRNPYPVEIQVSAAGFGDWTNDMSGSRDRIKAFFSVYPWAPHWKYRQLGLASAYDYMNEAYDCRYGSKCYSTAGISESREEYFFYPVILGINRAVEWIAARSDVDKGCFCYQGTSQGGGFGFYLVGLNHVFTKAVFYVPALTDTMGYLRGRQSGWPQIVESQRESKRATAERFAPYFDGANFASRIQCPVRVAVGFADTVCAPCAVYAAYNEIRVKDKKIGHGFGMPHSCFGRFYEEFGNWLWADDASKPKRGDL